MVRGELNLGYQGEGGGGEVKQGGVEEEGGVQLQRKLGLASGISLIVGWSYNAFLHLNFLTVTAHQHHAYNIKYLLTSKVNLQREWPLR